MSLNEEVDLLRRIPLFASLEPAKLKLLAFTSERVSFEPGQILFNQGDSGDAAFIIIEGEAEVLADSGRGMVAVARVGRNEFVGEIAILCDVPRTATVRAVSRVVTLRISKTLFFKLVREFPVMAVAIMRELAHRLEDTTVRLRKALVEVERV